MILSPQNGVKSQRYQVILYLDIQMVALYWLVFVFLSQIYTQSIFTFVFSFFLLYRTPPRNIHFTLARKRRRCGSRLLRSDILQCTCHLTFHPNDGQGCVSTFSLSQRACSNIFCSSGCIGWQNCNCCHSHSADVKVWFQKFYLLSSCSLKSATQPPFSTKGEQTAARLLVPEMYWITTAAA